MFEPNSDASKPYAARLGVQSVFNLLKSEMRNAICELVHTAIHSGQAVV
ncbi:hypothetical protein NHH03_15635 [Stieleria sp. TO1_6]|nr:hypothetical protein [Stieleria tagensis]